MGTWLSFQLNGAVRGRRRMVTIGDRTQIWAELHQGSASAAYANPPEWCEMRTWKAHLRPNDLFIDVGANVGLYSLFAIDCEANVVAFEPDEQARARLRENAALNNAITIQIRSEAVADRSGEMHFTQGRGLMNQLVLREPDSSTVGVRVITLDEVIGARVVAGLKVDVEGAERLVLEGATRALSSHRIKLIQLEWNPYCEKLLGEDRTPVADLLRLHGYRLFRPTEDGGRLAVQPMDYGSDVFACPEEPAFAAAD
jgi:FkbM family methyltransferase